MDPPVRRLVDRLVAAALEAIEPSRTTARAVSRIVGGRERVAVIACGKAAAGMTVGAAEALGSRVSGGVVLAPAGLSKPELAGLQVFEVDHPIPTARNAAAALAVAEFARTVTADQTALVLLSGGGSAHLALPAEPLTIDDLQALTRVLLAGGMSIEEMNSVRAHCEIFKGGRLMECLVGAGRVVTLAISDVAGDDLGVIASGPTSPDATTFAEALKVLDRGCPAEGLGAVRAHLEAGAAGQHSETPKLGDPIFDGAVAEVIASGADAAASAAALLTRWGVAVEPFRSGVTGDAAEIGRVLAQRTLATASTSEGPTAVVWSGETTVRLGDDPPPGGRNQHLALAAAIGLDGAEDVWVLSLATDGVDGTTEDAGAVVDGSTAQRIQGLGRDPAADLASCDAHASLGAVGALICTGPTGTNVADLMIGVSGLGWLAERVH